MPLDDFDDERDEFRQPLPRDDRLWLHPSELGADRPPAPVALGQSERSRRRNLVASGTVVLGAAAVIGMVFLASTMRETPSPTTLALRPGAISPTALAQQGLVRIDAGDGASVPTRSGTALVLRPDGYLLTSLSVIAAGTPLFAAWPDGRRLPATVVGADKVSGLAVVRVDATGLPVTATGSAADLSAGDVATAVGALGTPMATGTVTQVHAVDTAAAVSDMGALNGLIAVDSASASTGAAESAVLVDSRGRVMALCLWPAYDAAAGDSPAAAGSATPVSVTKMARGYAIPIDQARATADELIATGQATHPWLGVRGTDVDMSSAPVTGPTAGAELTLVQPGSPAERAGLQAGDVVTAVGRDSIGSMADLVAEIQAHPPGSAMSITYSRAGKPHTTKAILEVMPS